MTFHRLGLSGITFVEERNGVRHGVISAMRANKLLDKGCQGYLAHLVLNDATPSSVEEVRVVRHFRMSFLMICLDYRWIEMWSSLSISCQERTLFL